MTTLKNKSKSELIEEIESLKNQVQNFEGIKRESTHAANELRESEEKFSKSFFDNPTPMIIMNVKTGDRIDVNDSYVKMSGYDRNELLEGNINKKNLAFSQKRLKEIIRKTIKKGYVSNEYFQFVNKAGEIITTLLSGTKLNIGDGNKIVYSCLDVTEREETKRKLKESEEKYRELVEQSPTAIQIMTPDGWTIQVNSAFMKLWGYSDEALQKIYEKYNILQDEQARKLGVMPLIEKAFAGEVVFIPLLEYSPLETMETLGFTKIEGRNRWIQPRLFPVKNKDGEIINLVLMMEDITERKLAEDALKEQSYLNQQILETTLDGYILGDSDGKIIDVNPAYCDMIGYTWEELLGMNIREVEAKIPPEEVDRRIQQMIRRGGDRFETQHKHKDGHILELDTSTSIMYIDEAPLVAAFMRDITKRKKAEDALKTSEDRLRLTTTQVPAVLWTTDTDLRFTSSTGAGLKVLRLKTDQVVGMTMSEYLQTDDPENVVVKAHYQALKGRLATYEFEWEGRVFDSYVKPLQNQEGKTIGIIGFSLDITERKRVGEALKKSEEKFRKMFNESPIGIELYKADGMQLTANKASLKMFGIPDESEIYGFNIFDGSSLDVEKKEKLRRGETVEYQTAFDFEKVKELQQFKTDRIGIAYFDYIITPLLDTEKQTIQGYLLQVQDITGRKKVDEALRNSEKKFREMADLSPLIVYEIDINRKLTFFNKRASSVFGFSEHDLMSNFNALDRVIPEDRDRARENMKKIMNGKPVRNTEYTLIKKDGSTFPVLIYSNPVMKDNKPVGLRGIIIDMTERKLAENKIKESQQRLSSHLNNTPLGSIFWNINFKVIEWNSSAEQIFGYRKKKHWENIHTN